MLEQTTGWISEKVPNESGLYDTRLGRGRTFANVPNDQYKLLRVTVSSRPDIARHLWYFSDNGWARLPFEAVAGSAAMFLIESLLKAGSLASSGGIQRLPALSLPAYKEMFTGALQAPRPESWLRVFEQLRLLKEAKIRIVDEYAVGQYLLKHPGLEQVVVTAARAAQAHFPHADTFSLELYLDPEGVDEYLIVYAELSALRDRDYELLERVKAEYLPSLERVESGWVAVHIRLTKATGA